MTAEFHTIGGNGPPASHRPFKLAKGGNVKKPGAIWLTKIGPNSIDGCVANQ